jgi:mannose-6-phosphate isomerase-like protein (cupin superfamily)
LEEATVGLTDVAAKKPNYTVKNVEAIIVGADAQARIITLAPGQLIPWHRHSEVTDHYFVLSGNLTIETRDPLGHRELGISARHRIQPGTAHLLSNRGATDCEFLLLQAGGTYDWIKSEG